MTLPSPLLRTVSILSFLLALPLCITHGALSHDVVPAVGLVPLFFSASVSLFLLIRARRSGRGKAPQRDQESELGPEGSLVRGLGGADGAEDEGLNAEESRRLLDPDDDEDGGRDGSPGRESALTHRILVFVVDVILAAGLMVVLVFTWIRTGRQGDKRPELAMLAAYGTIPLLANFLIHSYLAAREFVAGLAIPSLIEYAAWRMVPADCPHCGSKLRPDSLPPIPWYETVSRPKVSMRQMETPSIPRLSLPAFKLPKLSGLKGLWEWKVPAWMRGRNQEYASLFVDDDQNERDRYRDDPDDIIGEPSGNTTVVATGSVDPTPVVEEVVVGKKDKRGKNGSGSALFGEGEPSWA
ncbi:hypothetical protein VTI74DRAFT_8971 [Chaetomium olivicolor]